MISRWIIFSLCLLLSTAGASVTVGWKMPMRALVYGDEMEGRFPKLDKPPAESAFFQVGDELWDVSKARPWPESTAAEGDGGDPFGVEQKSRPWRGEWLVWNARSGMFVARGSWLDILAVDTALGFKERPHLIRSVFELEKGGKPDRMLTVVSRSGERASMKAGGMEVAFTASGSEDGCITDVSVFASWQAHKPDTCWEVWTGVSPQERSRHLIASQGSGESAWQLFLTVHREALDGIPEPEARQIEMGAKLRPWVGSSLGERPFRKTLDEDRFAASYPVYFGFFTLNQAELTLPVVEVPEALKPFVSGPMLDVRERLGELGINGSKRGFFTGFDPSSSRVYVVGDRDAVDLWEHFGPMYDGPDGCLWFSSNEASGAWGLTARSGEKASILRRDASGEEDLCFEIEPVVGAGGELIDLRLKADIVASGSSAGRVESMVTLETGKPKEVARRKSPEGDELRVEVSATMVPFER